jgi:hypothetical protein
VKAAIDILETAFQTVLVTVRAPTTLPAKFIRVSRVGGGQPNPRFDIARLLVECWADESVGGYGTAETMGDQARTALRNAAGTTVATDVFIHAWDNEDGPLDYDDPAVPSMRRRQFTGDLQVSTRVVTGGS